MVMEIAIVSFVYF